MEKESHLCTPETGKGNQKAQGRKGLKESEEANKRKNKKFQKACRKYKKISTFALPKRKNGSRKRNAEGKKNEKLKSQDTEI